MLEGAAARSDGTNKIKHIDLAIKRVEVGEMTISSVLTQY